MSADTTAVPILLQSNEIVSNEVKTTKHYYSHHTEKNQTNIWPSQYFKSLACF